MKHYNSQKNNANASGPKNAVDQDLLHATSEGNYQMTPWYYVPKKNIRGGGNYAVSHLLLRHLHFFIPTY